MTNKGEEARNGNTVNLLLLKKREPLVRSWRKESSLHFMPPMNKRHIKSSPNCVYFFIPNFFINIIFMYNFLFFFFFPKFFYPFYLNSKLGGSI